MVRVGSVTLVLGADRRYVILCYAKKIFRYHLSEYETTKTQTHEYTGSRHIARVVEFLKMAKKGLKRKQKTEIVKKEDEAKVILPLVRRSDEPVTKKVCFLIQFYFYTFSFYVDSHIHNICEIIEF